MVPFQEALALARRFYSTAACSSDRTDPLLGDRMIGIALHFLGEQVEARKHIERMIDRYVTPIHDMIETLVTDRSDQPFGKAILPG
jgi:hypothetical protein